MFQFYLLICKHELFYFIGVICVKVRKLKLRNFRGYEYVTVEFNPRLNVLIGENDVGKSTILDALNIFFNDDVKPEVTDCNIEAEDKEIEITVCFMVDNDKKIILDATNPTSLKDEYILNKEGLLEVTKVINASGKSITKSSIKVYLNTYRPRITDNHLITYKQNDLKDLLKENESQIEDYSEINKSKKADMRKALYKLLINDETEYVEELINIKSIQDDSLKTWDKLRDQLPFYTLFQSDRANTDGDKEVQDPMKAMTKEVLAELQEQLDEIKTEVTKRVEKIGEETIEKLKEFNEDIAEELTTVPELKNWDSIFRFNLDTDDGVPLNKRGSGVRRLILLSYFRAQAERDAAKSGKRSIIYAIEEPETSQHPKYQQMIIDSLLRISEKNTHQIFITTHTPEIAQMVEKESLILLEKDFNGKPRIVSDEKIKMQRIAKTLGINPTIYSRVVICVEGPNDANFLYNINKVIPEYNRIIDLKKADISIYPLQGGNLLHYVNKNHFRESNIIELHLYDNDVDKYKETVEKINREKDGRRFAIITQCREMENYIPIKLIEDRFQCNLSDHYDSWSEFDLPKQLVDIWDNNNFSDAKEKELAIKKIINGSLTKSITKEMLKEHGVFEEIKGWFEKINELYMKTSGEVFHN